jgi:hypothetical protein
MKKELSEKDLLLIPLIIKGYEETRDGWKVASRLDISVKTVYRLLHASGINVPDIHSDEFSDRKKLLHGDDAKKVVVDYMDGLMMSAIKRKYNVGNWAIKTAVLDSGMPLRPRGAQWRKINDNQALIMKNLYINDKFSQAQIAAKFRCSQVVVARVLNKMGVSIRSNSAKGREHANWKGGRIIMDGGYIGIYMESADPLFSMANRTGYVPEHRLVMARAIGRPLLRSETVHHINGKSSDNRLSNLQLRTGRHGKGTIYRCADCGSRNITTEEIADSN